MEMAILKDIILPIVLSILSAIIYSCAVFLFKTYRDNKKVEKLFEADARNYEQFKKYLYECCDNSYILTKKAVTKRYSIAENCVGTYYSLISHFEQLKNNLIYSINYSYIKDGKRNDEINEVIQTYTAFISDLELITMKNICGVIPINLTETFEIDLNQHIEKIDKFYNSIKNKKIK